MCRVTMGHLRVTIGHLRVTMGHLRLTLDYLKTTVVHIRVTLGHLKVTICNFFSELHPKVRPTCFASPDNTALCFMSFKTFIKSNEICPIITCSMQIRLEE